MHPYNKIVSFVVITESYRRFRTPFVRGVKVRLFCSPQRSVEMCDYASCDFLAKKYKTEYRTPCGKQHFREIATPDWVGHFTNETYSRVWNMLVKSLPNPAWLFLVNVVSHMDRTSTNRTASVEMCDMHLVIFLAKKYKTEPRTSTNRTASVKMCDTHLVIFLAKKYKTEHRTSTHVGNNISEK